MKCAVTIMQPLENVPDDSDDPTQAGGWFHAIVEVGISSVLLWPIDASSCTSDLKHLGNPFLWQGRLTNCVRTFVLERSFYSMKF